MKNIFITIYLCTFCLVLQAQTDKWPYDNNWIFSYSSNKLGTIMTFGKDTMSLKSVKKPLAIDFTNCVLSDKNGALLFFGNGCEIHDSNNKAIINGTGMIEGILKTQCSYGMPRTQMNTFLMYENSDTVQLIQSDVDKYYEGSDIKLFNVSMSQKKVLDKEVFATDSTKGAYIKAVKHSNGKDWWVIVNHRKFDYYHTLHINKEGFVEKKKIDYPKKGIFCYQIGQVNFSLDGKYYAFVDARNGLNLFRFDRCTGELSQQKKLKFPVYQADKGDFASGVCFSPNHRFLYACTSDSLFQYDLKAPNLNESRVLIEVLDRTFYDGALNATFYLMENAPDGRIYMCCSTGVLYMHFINKPNEKGKACDFRQHGINLGQYSRNIPNLSNYRLGASDVVCKAVKQNLSENNLHIYPNPTQDILHIEAENGEAIQRIEVYNTIGELVHIADYQTIEILLSTAAFPNGIYFLRVEYSNKKVSATKFIVLR